MAEYNPELLDKPRWLVINQIDKISNLTERAAVVKKIVSGLKWKDKVFAISALTGEGTKELCFALMQRVDEMKNPEA